MEERNRCLSSSDIPVSSTQQLNLSQPKGGWLIARELARYKLDLVGVQVRWDKGGTIRAGDFNFFYGKETKIINWEQDFCTHIVKLTQEDVETLNNLLNK